MPDDVTPNRTPGTAMITSASRVAQFIEEAALNPDFDIIKFETLVRLQLELQDRQDKGDFNEAFAGVQAEMSPVLRSRENKHLGNKYAPLDEIDAMLRPICDKWGLSVRFGGMTGAPEGFSRKTITVSKGRYSETNWLDIPNVVRGARGGTTQANEQQQVGAVSTYARRYLLNEFFHIATMAGEDTDGHIDLGQTEHTGSRQSGNGPRVDHEQYKAAFRRRLHLAANTDEVNALLDIPDIAKWLADAPAQIKVDTDIMVATKRKLLSEAAAKAAQTGGGEQTGEQTVMQPSEQARALLARIDSCLTTVALDSLTTAPEFTGEVAKLSWVEGDLVTEALKAKGAALAGAPGAGA
jgi:hypothetical protein